MVTGVWGKKIGMSQLFIKEKVVPVTVIDTSNWLVTQIKTEEKDGYKAIQVGSLKPKYIGKDFDNNWLKKPKNYFTHIKEIKIQDLTNEIEVGKSADFLSTLQEGMNLDISGLTIGRGFAGCVKRHGFGGGRGSHGDKVGRRPGSMSFMRSRGRVIKGKRLPGHMGVEKVTMKNLELIKIDQDSKILLIKGSVPGKSGSLIFCKVR